MTRTYENSVFINCPFDPAYRPLLEAAAFATYECGFFPRASLEVDDSSQVRIEKITTIIRECRLAIHDISRTELDAATQLPRFNMPLELGIFLGRSRSGRSCTGVRPPSSSIPSRIATRSSSRTSPDRTSGRTAAKPRR